MIKEKRACGKVLLVSLLFLILLSGLSGCLDEKSKFIGSWQTADGLTTITFKNDNTATVTGSGPLGIVGLTGTFNYSIANQKITFSSGSFGITLNYSFPSSSQLILSNDQGASVVLNKM
jgi:hypothetical protein